MLPQALPVVLRVELLSEHFRHCAFGATIVFEQFFETVFRPTRFTRNAECLDGFDHAIPVRFRQVVIERQAEEPVADGLRHWAISLTPA